MVVSAAPPVAVQASSLPSTPYTQAERDADVKIIRSWWYAGTKQSGPDSLLRLKPWIDAHPEDAEAVFFTLMGLSAEPRFDLDSINSIALMKKAADSGFAPAKVQCALMLMGKGSLVDDNLVDVKKGRELLEQCVAAGDEYALFCKAGLCHRGEAGYKKNLQTARSLYQKAAQAGCTRSFAYLGSIDVWYGLEEPAVAWFEKGIASGDTAAQLALAAYQMYRAKTPDDKAAAFAAVEKIVQDNPTFASAHDMLADFYYHGKGVRKDMDKFLHHQKLAWECGDLGSGLYIAKLHIEWRIPGADPAKGLEILRKLVNKKHPAAQSYLARLMLQGILVERNVAEARRLMELAAAHGDEEAEFYLKWFSSAEAAEPKSQKP